MEDPQMGRLKTSVELAAENQELAAEKESAQQQAADMAALLVRYQEQFGSLDNSEET